MYIRRHLGRFRWTGTRTRLETRNEARSGTKSKEDAATYLSLSTRRRRSGMDPESTWLHNNQPASQSTNQPTCQATDQPTNQPANQPSMQLNTPFSVDSTVRPTPYNRHHTSVWSVDSCRELWYSLYAGEGVYNLLPAANIVRAVSTYALPNST